MWTASGYGGGRNGPPRVGGRSSEVRGAAVAARPAWSWWRARPTGVGSALAVLVAVLALGAAAPAQAQTTYVSNLNQTSDPFSSAMLAQSFTTGSQTGGYALGSVELSVGTIGAGGTVAAVIYETDTSGLPTTTVKHTLMPPSAFPSDSTLTFTAPADATLDAGTTYSVVFMAVSGGGAVGFKRTDSTSEDVAETGWSIGDKYAFQQSGSWQNSSSRSLVIAVKGAPWTATRSPPTGASSPMRSARAKRSG